MDKNGINMKCLTLNQHGIAPVKITRPKFDTLAISPGDVVKVAFEYILPLNDQLHVLLLDVVILSRIGQHFYEVCVLDPFPLDEQDLSSVIVPDHSVADVCSAAA